MKDQVKSLFARIDEMAVRERIYIFLGILVSAGAIADIGFISPALSNRSEVQTKLKSQTAELMRLRTDSLNGIKPMDPVQAAKNSMAELDVKEKDLDEKIHDISHNGLGSSDIEKVLVEILHKHESLTLLGIATSAVPVDKESGKKQIQIARRTLTMRLSGTYAELTRYVKKLEVAMPDLRWGVLEMKSEKSVTEMTLQIDILGVGK